VPIFDPTDISDREREWRDQTDETLRFYDDGEPDPRFRWGDDDDGDSHHVHREHLRSAEAAAKPLVTIEPRKAGGGRARPHSLSRPFNDRAAIAEVFARPDRTGDDNESHGSDDKRADRRRGYGVVATGRTGAPVGRPRRGTKNPERATELLLERCPGRTIQDLRGCLGRGKKTSQAREIAAELSIAVQDITGARKATQAALMAALDCSKATIGRMLAN